MASKTPETPPPVPEALQKWRSEGEIVELLHRKIFMHRTGPQGDDAVLIVHGYPGSSWDWQGVVEHIGDRAQTIVIDMRGFGLSEKPLDGTYKSEYSLMLQADLYEAAAVHCRLKTCILVAHDMGQTVGLELMARQEEGRTPFDIRHAILLNGSTLVDMVELIPMQVQLLKQPDEPAPQDLPFETFTKGLEPTFSKETKAKDNFQEILDSMAHQVCYNHGSRVMAQTLRYLKEREEDFNRWSRTFFTYQASPMTLIWGVQDPVAVAAMADRVKRERPYTDLYKYDDVAHWPSIEAPIRIADAILARLGSLPVPKDDAGN